MELRLAVIIATLYVVLSLSDFIDKSCVNTITLNIIEKNCIEVLCDNLQSHITVSYILSLSAQLIFTL